MASKLLVARSGSRVESLAVGTLAVDELTVGGEAVTETAVLLGSGEAVDLNGEAAGIVLDADGDTSISAPTDDQIDIEVSGADDFRITANTLTALSGSAIQTNTIAETTAANGVVVDGMTIKDGVAKTPNSVVNVSADGAITLPAGNTDHFITKAGVAAMTIVDPTSGAPGTGHDGVHLTFIATTANAHTLDNSAGSGFFSSGGASKDVATWGGAIGDRLEIVAFGGKWYIADSLNVTLS